MQGRRAALWGVYITRQTMRNFRSSPWAGIKVVENVPALGESITEGTITSWTKQVGEAVALDEVVVVVETDKVTVDIKATNAGVITQQLATGDVAVGQPLFEVDTEGTSFAAPAPSSTVTASNMDSISESPKSNTNEHHRTPLIKFLGKRSLVKHDIPSPAVMPFPSAQPLMAKAPAKEGTGVDFRTMKGGAMFGRPEMTEREMELIASGGAVDF